MVLMTTWTKENTETLVRLKAEGKSSSEIAEFFGVTLETIKSKSKRLKVASTWSPETGAWTKEATETLIRMRGEGYSTSQIARAIGVGKGSVSSKVRTLKLPKIKPRTKVGPAILPVAFSTYTEEEVRVVDESLMRPWTERQFGQCAFPIVRGEVTYSCCADVEGHKSYCPEHRRVMYLPSQAAKPRPAHIKTDGRHLP